MDLACLYELRPIRDPIVTTLASPCRRVLGRIHDATVSLQVESWLTPSLSLLEEHSDTDNQGLGYLEVIFQGTQFLYPLLDCFTALLGTHHCVKHFCS